MRVLAIFGPTAVGKTGVAIEVAERLRERGEDPVAVSCDAMQVYRGFEIVSGAASADDRARLEHRLLGIAELDEEFSAGRFAELAHAEIDELLAAAGGRSWSAGRASICARLAHLDMRPPVPWRSARQSRRRSPVVGPRRFTPSSPTSSARACAGDRKRIVR